MSDSQTDDNEIEVDVSVENHELDQQQQRVVDVYEENIATFIRKNENYGGSFENSAKLESIMRHGEVREDELFDIIADQILVRGFYDKLSRFHQLQIQGGDDLVGEKVEDTLLDLGNYAIMLAAMRRKYEESGLRTVEIDVADDGVWGEEEIKEFIEKHGDGSGSVSSASSSIIDAALEDAEDS